jgi:hypothetical protein
MSLPADLALGVRLAVGGGRTLKTSLLRLTLTTIGIGLSAAVLLLLASVLTALSTHNARDAAREPQQARTADAPLYEIVDMMVYGGADIQVVYLDPTTPAAPVPPGVQATPAPGEMVVSPALAAKLGTETDLRARFGERVAGTIAPEGLAGPNDLLAYAGAQDLRGSAKALGVSGFGGESSWRSLRGDLVFLGVLGVLVLLVPMLVFVAATSRIAGAERERRLSALRLAGASARQVRRIGAAESLVGAATGGLLGLVVFLAVRPWMAGVDLAGIAWYPGDFVPAWPLAVAVFVLLPVITVGAAWFGMRRLVIEPLGVLRQGKPARRRGWWRLLLVVLGVLFLLPDKVFGAGGGPNAMLPYLVAGIALLLVGVPVLMPWLTEFAVSRIRGGFPAWQLAIRRLQLDSGTPSRVVAGVVVVLAGVIALQSLLDSVIADQPREMSRYEKSSNATVSLEAGSEADALRRVRAQPGVQTADVEYRGVLTARATSYSLLVAPCAVLERDYRMAGCGDGDTFITAGPRPGETFSLMAPYGSAPGQAPFTVPATAKAVTSVGGWSTVLVTPAAATALDPSALAVSLAVRLDPARPDSAQAVYVAMAPLGWRASVYADEVITSDGIVPALRGLLYAGALLTLSLAGVSLLVMTVGQISERRRPLAAMSAGGVPRGVLARSLLWQNAVPMVFGVLVAVAAGIGIGVLTLRLIGDGLSFVLNGTFVLIVASAAVVLVLAVTTATLPVLRSATKLEALRAE